MKEKGRLSIIDNDNDEADDDGSDRFSL